MTLIYENIATAQRLANLQIPCPFPIDPPLGTVCTESGLLHCVHRAKTGRQKGILVLADVSIKADGKLWYHVSFSRANQIPDYQDREWVKRFWFGPDRWAIEVLPEAKNHVNIHPYCLHLWHCLEDRPFPEFSQGGMV